jgi:tetratricopeptide (TPR) repeat protein
MPFLLRAAERSRELFANSEAFRLFSELESIASNEGGLEPDGQMKLALGFGDVLYDRGNVGEAQSRFDECLRLARAQHAAGLAIDCLRRLSSSHRVLGDLDGALQMARTAVEEARDYGDERRLIESLTRLAAVHVPRAEYDQTLSVAEEARERSEQANDSHNWSIALSLIGAAYMHRGEYRRASESLRSAISMQRSLGDQKGLASSLNISGLALHRMAKFSLSIAQHEESLKIKRAIQDVSAIPGSLNALGDVLRDCGQVVRALEVHSQSLEISRQHGNRAAECDNLRDLAVDYVLLGDIERGQMRLDEVLRISREFKYPWYESRALSTLSGINLSRGEFEQAEAASTQALTLAQQIGALEPLVEASLASARVIVERSNNSASALALLREGLRLAESGDLELPLPSMYFALSQIQRKDGDENGANLTLQSARRYLLQAAESISDPAMRQTFLNTPLSTSILARSG